MSVVPLLQWVVDHFARIQYALLGIIALAVFFYLNQKPATKFRTRESEREDLDRLLGRGSDLGTSTLKKRPPTPPPPPLHLPGIRLEGEPHEILGVPAQATEEEVLRAYKEAIKRFHPDTIQGPAKEQLEFYQRASAAINDAKNRMIRNLRGR